MKWSELIRKRRSVRTFDGRPVSGEDAEKILSFASSLEDPFGIPVSWKILSAAEHGLSSKVIVGADTWLAGKMKIVPRAEEAFGYLFEKISLYALSLGIGTTCIAGTMDRPAFEKAVELGEGEVMPCVTPLGPPAAKMSVREGLMRKGVGADERMDFGSLFFDGDLSTPLSREKAGRLAEALELVRLAPSAVNKQPWRVSVDGSRVCFFEKRSRGYKGKDGWDIQKIDMGIALSHFELGLEEAGISFSLSFDDPGMVPEEDTEFIASYIIS